MQHMQDKAFDQLFKDALEHAEIQPSADLWNNLAKDLKEPVVKRQLPIYWMVAAVVAVVLLSVLLLLPGQEKIKLQGAPMAVKDTRVAPVVVERAISTQDAAITNGDKSTPLVIAPRVNEAAMEKDFKAMQPKEVLVRHDIKIVPVMPEVRQAMVADPYSGQDMVIAKVDVTEAPAQNVTAETEEPEYKGIRNFGDLVNYVVDKVDKREHKFLKFSSDDDNSSLIGINIGFIRLNAKRHK
jgi:hypothetical protein